MPGSLCNMCLSSRPALAPFRRVHDLQNRHPQQLETGHGKQTKRAARNHISFSDGYNYFREKKKYKAHNLKYVPCILKYVRPIFGHAPKWCKICRCFFTGNADMENAFELGMYQPPPAAGLWKMERLCFQTGIRLIQKYY